MRRSPLALHLHLSRRLTARPWWHLCGAARLLARGRARLMLVDVPSRQRVRGHTLRTTLFVTFETDLYCQRSPRREPHTPYPKPYAPTRLLLRGAAPRASALDGPRLPACQHRTGHAFKPRAQASPATRVGDSAVKRTRTAQSVVSVCTAHVHVYTQTHMRHGGRPPSRSHECPTHGTLPPGRARVAHPTVSLRPRESYAVGGHFSPLEYLRSRHALHKSRKNVPSFRVYAFTCTSP